MAKSKRGDSGTNRRRGEQPSDKPRDPETSEREDKGLNYDRWQKEILETECNQNIAVRAGRQVGKSTIISALAGRKAVHTPKTSIMIISATERQAFLLFSKVLLYLHDNFRRWIKLGKDRPTKSEIKLTNGSIIRCLPTGLDGIGIRGYTTDVLIADEAAFIPENVWPAVTPQLATTGGKIILLSTPYGAQGYFYNSFSDPNFKTWHINAEEVAEERLEPQRTFMQVFQEREKATMTRLQYAQEYLGEFVTDFRRVFSDEIVAKSCILKRRLCNQDKDYYLGVDIARLGEDAGTYAIIEAMPDRETFEHVESIVTKKKLTTDTYDRIIGLDKQFNFRKIGIDAGSGSLGVGILDFLIRDPQVKRKVIALNNLSRNLDHTGERKRGLLKEDMYFNLLAMLEKDKLKLLDDDELQASLRAIQYEYVVSPGKKTSVKIFAAQHKYTDLIEGLMRAAWLANEKRLNTSISYI